MVAKVLAQQEALLLEAHIGGLAECKHLEEDDIVRLTDKCKVRHTTEAGRAPTPISHDLPISLLPSEAWAATCT